MGKLKAFITVSADGYAAGPDQSEDNPLGVGGEELHEWLIPLKAFNEAHGREGGEVTASSPVVEAWFENVGAEIMGRNMFGGGPGPWSEEPWTGWWGEEPPFHVPVFVLTHHPREPLEMEGGTTFHFVTDGIESAHEQASTAAGDRDVIIGGGGEVARQYLAAGLIDEMWLHVVPILLGAGAPLFDETTAGSNLEQVRVVDAPGVAHLNYRSAA
jgi:dihydrofolate reductase